MKLTAEPIPVPLVIVDGLVNVTAVPAYINSLEVKAVPILTLLVALKT